MVVSGLVLGALIMTMIEDPVTGSAGQQPEGQIPRSPVLESPGPSVVPAAATAESAVHTALLQMTTQPGISNLRLRR